MSLSQFLAERGRKLQKSFRSKRMGRFAATFPLTESKRILDVGGTPEIWRLLGESLPNRAPSVVLLNMPRADAGRASAEAGLAFVHGNGCNIPFADGAFDIVFSNSVIEHVGGPAAQQQFAAEIMRTGQSFWVQTPNRYFPIEMHLLTPLVHLLPPAIRDFIVRRFSVWQWIRRPSPDEKNFYVEHFIADIHLLSASDMQRLFPDSIILRERFLLFTKSLVACRLPGPHDKRPATL